MGIWEACLGAAGVFTLLLGIVHFFLPVLLDFRSAVPKEGSPLKPLRLGFIRYATLRSDVHGIAWVMNHAASYVLVTIGALDLFASRWIQTPPGKLLAGWIAGWWFLRAVTQLYLGKRVGDWLILAGFVLLGGLHAGLAFR
jgi:hypothetical protein